MHDPDPDPDPVPSLPPLTADPRPGTAPLGATILGELGIELVAAGPDRVVVRCPVSDRVRGAGGQMSLGALLVLAETAASTGAGLAAGGGCRAFGLEIDGAAVAPVADGTVTCTGERIGGSASAGAGQEGAGRQVWRMRLVDDAGTVVGDARCTLAIRAAG